MGLMFGSCRNVNLAKIEDWQTFKDETGKRLNDAAFVILPEPSDSFSNSDPEMNLPLEKMTKRYRHERETSEDKKELRNRLKHGDRKQIQYIETRDNTWTVKIWA